MANGETLQTNRCEYVEASGFVLVDGQTDSGVMPIHARLLSVGITKIAAKFWGENGYTLPLLNHIGFARYHFGVNLFLEWFELQIERGEQKL